MKKIFLTIVLLLTVCCVANAQTAEPTTPPADEKVCISRDAAEKCSKAFDTVKAQEAQVAELKAVINDLKIQLAQMNGKLTANEEERARLTAIVDMLLKNPRRQIKVGIFNF